MGKGLATNKNEKAPKQSAAGVSPNPRRKERGPAARKAKAATEAEQRGYATTVTLD